MKSQVKKERFARFEAGSPVGFYASNPLTHKNSNCATGAEDRKVIKLITLIVLGLLIAIGLLLVASGMANQGAIVLGGAFALLVFSLTLLNGTEQGAEEVLGNPKRDVGPGLHFTPVGLVKIHILPRTNQQDELPADPEHIHHEDSPTPPGKFPPNRIKFGQPLPKEHPDYDPILEDDPYNVAMVAEVPVVVSWRITSPMQFRKSYGDIANCRKILNDKSVEVFIDEFSTMTPARALLKLRGISQEIQKHLVTETDLTGIEIRDAYAKGILFSHPLNTAVVGVQIAEREARAMEKRADGEANATRRKAEGRRDALIETGLAEATVDADGKNPKITRLVPDATTFAHTEAVKALRDLTGTVVFGGGSTGININTPQRKEDE